MVQKSGDHQLRLVNYPIIYKGSFSSQVVQDFFPPKVTVAKNVKFEHKFWDGKNDEPRIIVSCVCIYINGKICVASVSERCSSLHLHETQI